MPSEKQLLANRKNAQKSTGPKSLEGKALVSQNALKHGILSKELILPWEKTTDFESLELEINEYFRPLGAMEKLLVDRLTALTWRLKRIGQIETGLYSRNRYETLVNEATQHLQNCTITQKQKILEEIDGKLNPRIIRHEDLHQRSLDKILEYSPKIWEETPFLAKNFVDGSEAIEKLWKYERHIENSLYKTLREIESLQSKRHHKQA